MAESFVKTMKRDYVPFMPKPDAVTAARNLAIAFERYNEKHPHSADGTPIVGRTPLSNLFLNTGHGTLGWTMSCGSGQLLADLISGKQPAIKADDLSVYRYLGEQHG